MRLAQIRGQFCGFLRESLPTYSFAKADTIRLRNSTANAPSAPRADAFSSGSSSAGLCDWQHNMKWFLNLNAAFKFMLSSAVLLSLQLPLVFKL